MAKNQIDRFLNGLDERLSKLSPAEQRRVLAAGAELLETRRAQLSKRQSHARGREEKRAKTRAAS